MFKTIALLSVLMLAACHAGQHIPTRQSKQSTFTSKAYGLTISYPADFELRHGFTKSYLQNGSWKTYAQPTSQGRPLVSLVLKGSNAVTDAELRIGVSRNDKAVSKCTQPPGAFRKGSLDMDAARLDGVRFVTWKAADAAMSHYLKVRSYRTVHNGVCYAIDLLIYGSNPMVYDPPRKPPFTQQQAFKRLEAALKGFRFI